MSDLTYIIRVEQVEAKPVEVVRKPAPHDRRCFLQVTIPAEELADMSPAMRRLYGVPASEPTPDRIAWPGFEHFLT